MARFHTADGRFVGWHKLPNAGRALIQSVRRKLFGSIPRQPWIPFSAQRALRECLNPDSVVWEIGAGFSTLWLGDQCRSVVSLEASEEWYRRLSALIAREGRRNIDLRLEWNADRMADFSELPDAALDLLFIDGGPRGRCLHNGFRKVKPGGHVYLDNWDCPGYWGEWADFPSVHASELASVQSFVDYVPAQLGVYEGLLLRKAQVTPIR